MSSVCTGRFKKPKKKIWRKVTTEERALKVVDCDFSIGVLAHLKRKKMNTIGDIVAISAPEFLASYGFTRNYLGEVVENFHGRGVYLKDEEKLPPWFQDL